MVETVLKENTSPRLFDSIYDQYADFCKKLRFLLMGALSTEDAPLALEIISDFLGRKEIELQKLEDAAKNSIDPETGEPGPVEILLGRLLMEREDYRILLRLAELRRKGGRRWEMLQTLIGERGVETAAPVCLRNE